MISTGLNIAYSRPDASRHMKYVAAVASVTFAGTDDGLAIDDHNDFSPTDGSNNDKPFSIAVWVRNHIAGTGSTANALLFGKGTTTTTKEYKLFTHYGQLMFDIIDNADSHYYRVSGPAQTINNPHNTWYHIVATYDGSESATGMRLYKDGEELSVTSGSGGSYSGIANTNSKVAIGHRLDNTNYDLDGDMTDIMYWNDYCLSQEEITQIYNDGQYSVDPTVDTGDYEGASYCKLWLKCDAQYTVTAASQTTTYVESEEAPATPSGGSVELIAEEHAEFGNCEIREGGNCYKVIDPAGNPAVYGIEDFSGNNHHASNNGDGVSISAGTVPTATSVSNEYDTYF
tara:strand:+ start:1641 stop:2669 length:1029 start_codon:yes stop_codon:yes gene_type:complete